MTHASTARSSAGTAGTASTADTAGAVTAAALALMATDASTDKESVVDSEPLKPPPQKKKKIHTYNRRKVEITRLESEREELEELLRVQVESARTERKRRRKSDKERLQDLVHSQGLMLAKTMSIVSAFTLRAQESCPFKQRICLGKDHLERRDTIKSIKPLAIQDAIRNFREHLPFVDPTGEFSDCRRYQTPDGDMCTSRFEVIPFPGAKSVKQVFNVLEGFIRKMKSDAAKVLGDTMISDRGKDGDSGLITQHRLVSSLSDVVLTEMNNVNFAEYLPKSQPGVADCELGLVLSMSVDQDDLMPYIPAERIRLDMSIMDVVAKHPTPNQSEGADSVITITRWSHIRIHKSDLISVPWRLINNILQGVEAQDQILWQTVREQCE